MEQNRDEIKFQVSAFYRFVAVRDPDQLKAVLDEYLDKTDMLGTVLVAAEGVNGTISGLKVDVESFLVFLAGQLGIDELPYKVAQAPSRPFHRMKVRLKKEIVTLGVKGIDPLKKVGTYVCPKEWNDLIQREDVVLVDTRNEYEYTVGTFKGAKNPHTNSFREFPEYVNKTLDPKINTKVAMFCTGGIRCEKATSLMLEKGFKEVYHLEGGILEYFNQIPEDKSLWDGECFVFDERVTVDQNLRAGSYKMCHACRMPLSEDDQRSDHYEKGISCPHCHEQISEEKKARLQQRNLQMKLANERKELHLGQKHERHLQPVTDELA